MTDSDTMAACRALQEWFKSQDICSLNAIKIMKILIGNSIGSVGESHLDCYVGVHLFSQELLGVALAAQTLHHENSR